MFYLINDNYRASLVRRLATVPATVSLKNWDEVDIFTVIPRPCCRASPAIITRTGPSRKREKERERERESGAIRVHDIPVRQTGLVETGPCKGARLSRQTADRQLISASPLARPSSALSPSSLAFSLCGSRGRDGDGDSEEKGVKRMKSLSGVVSPCRDTPSNLRAIS